MSEDQVTEPWERQSNESVEAWEAFVAHRDTEGRRSLAATAAHLGKSPRLVERWSARWSWRDRISAWEAEQDRRWRQEIIRDRPKVARRHLDIAAKLRELALARLRQIAPADLSHPDLLRYLLAALTIESGLHGLEAETTDAQPVRIMLDPRLLPPGAQLPPPLKAVR